MNCVRKDRVLDIPGSSTYLSLFCDDGQRCPGHPDWQPRRTHAINACRGEAWRILRGRIDAFVPVDDACDGAMSDAADRTAAGMLDFIVDTSFVTNPAPELA